MIKGNKNIFKTMVIAKKMVCIIQNFFLFICFSKLITIYFFGSVTMYSIGCEKNPSNLRSVNANSCSLDLLHFTD